MNNKEYLEQISANVRPEKKSTGNTIFSSMIFKVVAGGVLAFILIAIFGAILSGGRVSVKDEVLDLQLYLDTTSEAISSYQSELKSSNLRASSASLNSVLSNTSRELADYIETTYGRDAKATTKMKDDEKLHADGLDADLFEAKINGILDRIYAHKMAYEISMIMSKESDLYDRVTKAEFREFIESSYNSLDTLYNEFNEFSETK